MEDLRHSCGLFGIVNHPEAADLTQLGLYAQQHRGQESAGICTTDGEHMLRHTAMGLVTDAIRPADIRRVRNPIAIGHVRYSTTGSCNAANAQPIVAKAAMGEVAIAHNGNLINAGALRNDYERRGRIFVTTSDTEIVLHMLADPRFRSQEDPLGAALQQLRGSFCLLLMYPDRIEAVRDPSGNRPLCLGRLNGAWIVASETCALDMIKAEFVREVEPGEIITLRAEGIESRFIPDANQQKTAHCIFELIYFADPSSRIFGQSVHLFRTALGAALTKIAPVEADLVIPVPNCARCAAIGYHHASGIPLGRGFTTSHYSGRSFIQPQQEIRDLTVRLKLNPIRESVEGKRLIVVEDSVVRGTTTRAKMQSLYDVGAKEIHLRVASPPIRHACYYGIDFPQRSELVAHTREVEDIRRYLDVDSLAYLPLDEMIRCVNTTLGEHFCTACFSGEYPIAIDEEFRKELFESTGEATGSVRHATETRICPDDA